MNTKHGAIETVYAGHRFRSRLEARWAVFFDALGIEWKYEIQGFEADGHRYLPDFFLPKANDWVEVKGDSKALTNDLPRMRVMLGHTSPVPGIAEGKSGLLLLGEIPNANTLVVHPLLVRESHSLKRKGAVFLPSYDSRPGVLVFADGGRIAQACGVVFRDDLDASDDPAAWDVSGVELDPMGNLCRDAYEAARHARFEHGESGAKR